MTWGDARETIERSSSPTRRAWERARRDRPGDEYYRARDAHEQAVELRKLAEEALRRLGELRWQC
jgi:hypothetical protein